MTKTETEKCEKVDDLKRYETVVNSGQSALKALLTLNGGATVAFLTFMGHLWDKGTLSRDSNHVLAGALQLFIYGAFMAVFAYGMIFLTNVLSERKREIPSNAMFVFTVICGFASIGCFLAASWRAMEGFKAVATVLPK